VSTALVLGGSCSTVQYNAKVWSALALSVREENWKLITTRLFSAGLTGIKACCLSELLPNLLAFSELLPNYGLSKVLLIREGCAHLLLAATLSWATR
jgi:hypothetical protein